MLHKVIIGSVLTIFAFSSMSSASAICCFPWEITHHVDPETGFLVVSGELWNDSYKREPFGKTSYQFIFEDENRNVLFEKDLLLTEKLPVKGGFVIPYAVSFPFQIIIDDVDIDLIKKVTLVHTGRTNTLDYFEWKPADLELSFETLKNFKTIHSETTDDVFTKWQITGKITNTHSEKTENVFVVASLFEEHDRFVGVAGYGEDDIQPLKLDGYETKDFIIHAIIPEEKKPDQVKLYAESNDSSMIHGAFMPLILKDTTYHEDRMSEGYKKPIPLSANVINTSRDNVDFEWIIQIKKSPKGLSEGDVGKYPDSKIEEIKYISSHVDGQNSTQLEYSWIPQKDGIYFYEYFIWTDSQALSFPFKGTFLQDTWIIADSSNDSLKNQLKSGIPFDSLECRFELVLVQKTKTGNFVCVKPESIPKLIERGWGEPEPVPEPEIDTIKDTDYDSEKFYEEFGPGSPLIYLETSKPVLDNDNCDRYAYWLTEHQKEKIDLYEDYPRYPPWGNQIFPLVDFCTANGDLLKFVVGDKIQWSFYKIYSENDPGPESFRSSEPSTKIELSFGQPYQDGLVPVTISEVTIYAEDLDEITVWNFGLIGHSGDDRRVAWDIIPKEDRIWYQIINDDSQDVIDNSDTPQYLVIPADQHIYEMNCGMFDNIEGESAHPTKFQIKPGNYAVIAKNSLIGIYPDSKGEYSFEFASIFPHYVRFAEDGGVEFSSDTKQCSSTWQIDSESEEVHGDGYYTSMNFRFE